MPQALKSSPVFIIFGALILGLYLFVETSGVAFGGSKKEKRVDPQQIRSSSPGSWTYIYWAHGSRGK